jgi:4-hydroxy-tetrahydrodipicolinate reductase
MPLAIALIGAAGRTGRAIAAAASANNAVVISLLSRKDDLGAGIERAEVVLDFSTHEATQQVIRWAAFYRRPLVIGTTGHAATAREELLRAAAVIPTVWSGNYSIGVNLLFALTQHATSLLGRDYDSEIIEAHHRFKRDAPSGTAARLVEVIREARPGSTSALHGRLGLFAERSPDEIGVHAIRGGDVVGDHTVIFAGTGERVELAHKASDRAIFARGALRAAHWVRTQQPGVYDMQDVLGLT